MRNYNIIFYIQRFPISICYILYLFFKSASCYFVNYVFESIWLEKSCNEYHSKISICGISLGVILALNYAVEHLQKVQSLILIAPQFKMPKGMLYVQSIAFHLMPEIKFLEMGISKKDALSLIKSMLRLDFRAELSRLTCPVMIICGEKDRAICTVLINTSSTSLKPVLPVFSSLESIPSPFCISLIAV